MAKASGTPSEMTGKKAPAFTLPDQEGKKHKLSDYKGKHVVLFFYPKDDTPSFGLTQ
jgi:peroxiredoxin Q/BCP